MSRLADVLDARSEVAGQRTRLPRVSGAIAFERVSFRYRPETPEVIRGLTLQIRPGEVIGIVGRSGSGKSTLAKLVQRLYVCESGRVTVDGQDIAIIDTTSLRQQIGVVLQENTLFSRSIRDNIALVDSSAPIEQVIAAAKLAGAHDFICELPEGYDTLVGEQGSGLSGGQRQRIAIARALISNPGILIFDEATSALDYESEKIIQDNMRQICAGRTVLIIAHRLSAVRDADRIVVMERGSVVESGSHEQLLMLPDGIYAHLSLWARTAACLAPARSAPERLLQRAGGRIPAGRAFAAGVARLGQPALDCAAAHGDGLAHAAVVAGGPHRHRGQRHRQGHSVGPHQDHRLHRGGQRARHPGQGRAARAGRPGPHGTRCHQQ
ncbi:hypothetical protein Lal_00037181 [Lupinus albus]|nr:hypothetical protein Lal_00037181 [Lupinus albus]